jgi:hypothetical protein
MERLPHTIKRFQTCYVRQLKPDKTATTPSVLSHALFSEFGKSCYDVVYYQRFGRLGQGMFSSCKCFGSAVVEGPLQPPTLLSRKPSEGDETAYFQDRLAVIEVGRNAHHSPQEL